MQTLISVCGIRIDSRLVGASTLSQLTSSIQLEVSLIVSMFAYPPLRRKVMQRLGSLCLLILPLCALAQAELRPSRDCLSVGRKAFEVEAKCWSMKHDGRTRTVRLYVPARLERKAGMIFVLHGGGGSAGATERLTKRGFHRIADRDGVLIAYPEGVDKQWNDGRRDLNAKAVRERVDDVAFLLALAQSLTQRLGIDRQRLFATGISNGGMMSFRLACDAASTFAAVAPVAANLSEDLEPNCKPARPISIAIVNGVDDPIDPWNGGPIKVLWSGRGTVLSTPKTVDRWLQLNRCTALQSVGSLIDKVRDDGTTLRQHRAQCTDHTSVVLYEIRGGGHTWPSGEAYLGPRLVGRVSYELDANEAIWSFFREQPRRDTE